MVRTAALGFALTVGVLVPAGWHWLGASIEVDGKHLRPLQETFELDGAKIHLDVDRTVVMTGDTVRATLVAESDTPRQVVVDLRTLHTENYAGERVERPWSQIDRETITLTAMPGGGKPVSTALTLGQRPKRLALEDSFKVVAMAHGVKVPTREFDSNDPARDFDAVIGDGKAAAISIRGWSGNNLGMKIEARDRVTADAPFKIAVSIKNTTGRKLDHAPWVSLTTEAALGATEDDTSAPSLQIESVDRPEAENESDRVFERGATSVSEFVVTPHGKLPQTITFLASATENDGLGPYGAGAMDATTFQVTETAKPNVASK